MKDNKFEIKNGRVFMKNKNEQQQKHKRKLGKFGKKLVTILVSCTLAASAATLLTNSIENFVTESYSQYQEMDDYLMKTNFGSYVKLPIDENPISIVLQNISDEDKQKVIGAINDLDNISTNLDYTILESDDVNIKNKIYITDGETPSDALGVADVTYNNFTGLIQYPIHIKIDMDACHGFFSDITGEDAVSAVVKHELGHAHGFCDIYDTSLMDETIMYYTIYTETYTPSDEERYRKYYGGVKEDASFRYDYYYDVDENGNLGDLNAVNDNSLENKQSALSLVHKDILAEVYEPNQLVITNEKEKKSSKTEDSNEREL